MQVNKGEKYGVISGSKAGKYGPEITPCLNTFRAVGIFLENWFLLLLEYELT